MYSGDEVYSDDITSGVIEDDSHCICGEPRPCPHVDDCEPEGQEGGRA